MTKDQRKYENIGQRAAIKGMRTRISTMGRKGILDTSAVFALRASIREYIADCSHREGGPGRK